MLAAKWGQRGAEKHSTVRPAFSGIVRRSPIDYTDHDNYFPRHCFEFGDIIKMPGRLPRQIMSGLVLLCIAVVEVFVTIYISTFRRQWATNSDWALNEWAEQITGIMTVCQMALFSFVGKFLARKLNQWENYRTSSTFVNGLITKVFLFEFVNRFMTFFLIAFVQGKWLQGCLMFDTESNATKHYSPAEMNGNMCYYELQGQAQVVLAVEMLKNATELLLPWLKPKLRKMLKKNTLSPEALAVDAETGQARMSHFVQQAMDKDSYGEFEVDGTFYDYMEVMILVGYIMLFSIVFPLMPVLGMGLLLFEIRVDGLKIFEVVRRPLPVSVESIGNWLWVMHFLTCMAIFTNSALSIWTLTLFDGGHFGESDRPRFFLIVFLLLLVLKIGLVILVPDVPNALEILEDHHGYIREQFDNEDRALRRRPVSLASLDISVQDAESGQMRDPRDFGLSSERVKRRLNSLKKAKAGWAANLSVGAVLADVMDS